jgi:hypothetical protein
MVREKEAGMSAKGQVSIDLDLAFAAAGVGFAVQVRDTSAAIGAALQIVLRALDDDLTARFTPECSHALSDFVGGFCQMLEDKCGAYPYAIVSCSEPYDSTAAASEAMVSSSAPFFGAICPAVASTRAARGGMAKRPAGNAAAAAIPGIGHV